MKHVALISAITYGVLVAAMMFTVMTSLLKMKSGRRIPLPEEEEDGL